MDTQNRNSQPDLNSFIDNLDRKMWITKGARYNGSRRLLRKHNLSLATIAFLSAYVLTASVSQFTLPLTTQQLAVINFATIGMAIFILTLSLLESAHNYQSKSRSLHDCANEISSLLEKLNIAKVTLDDESLRGKVKEISKTYHDIIVRYGDNHEPIDNELFRAEHPKEFHSGQTFLLRKQVQLFLKNESVYWLLIILLPVSLILAVVKFR